MKFPSLFLFSNGKGITEYRAWSNEYTRLADGAFSVAFSPDRGSGLGGRDVVGDDCGRRVPSDFQGSGKVAGWK
jgi:hypothetical protein